MHVVFVEPCFPAHQREFVRGLSLTGATVSAVGEHPVEALDDELRRWLIHYEQVPSVVDPNALERVVRWIHYRLPVDRLEATVEAHVLPVAEARERLGIPGTPPRTAFLCRDKPAMKEALRAGGVPCATFLGSGDREAIFSFAREAGYPLVVKPRAGSAARGVERVDSGEALGAALDRAGVGEGPEVAVEAWNDGHEAFYDTITIGGRVAHEFIAHCYPNVLEAMRTRWISPQVVVTNRVKSAPGYQEVLEMGRNAIRILGIDTSATHMEWFVGPEGLRFSDMGCRPPGEQGWTLCSVANDIDVHHEWATAVVFGRTVRKASRRFATGLIGLRPDQDGVIRGYSGADEIWRRWGEWIIDSHFPPPGTPTRPIDAGYMANAWLRMKHPDYDELRGMLDTVGETVHVSAT